MSKFLFTGLFLVTGTAMACAAVATPGPLLGAVAGPWGLVASGLTYGAYRVLRAKR